jgi:tRNA A-37 threonylcarbamoyl transferase component Bud32
MEDETRFESVRRLVEYEDYALRLVRDAGIPTATPYGIVEITPEREYMLVTSFIEGAAEIGDAEVDVDDAVIDEALGIVRQLWDAGLAHRDIKPANLMVADGRVYLIDAAFAQVRPSPWRQAVDLGNMMLVLAVRTDAPRVYERALAYFTPDDVAEAFAATRGVASPTQLRSVLRQDGRDLAAEFRSLAPPRRRIAVQRWSFRRVALAVGVAVGLIFAVQLSVGMFTPSHDIPSPGTPDCGTGSLTVLVAQSVPSATQVPCIAALPAGWISEPAHVERGKATFWLSSDQGGDHAVKVTLVPRAACDVGRATPVPSDEPGADRYEQPRRLRPLATTRFYLFDGGCVRYDIAFTSGAETELLFDVDQAVGFIPRERLVDHVRDKTGLSLCGAGAACEG